MRGATLAAEFTARHSGDVDQPGRAAGEFARRQRFDLAGTLAGAVRALPAADRPGLQAIFATGGADLPRIAGRMEQAGSGPLSLRLRMNEYAAGDARLAVPELALTQAGDGRIGLTGKCSRAARCRAGSRADWCCRWTALIGADGASPCGMVAAGAVRSAATRQPVARAAEPAPLPAAQASRSCATAQAGCTSRPGRTHSILHGHLGETPISLGQRAGRVRMARRDVGARCCGRRSVRPPRPSRLW